MLLQYITTVFNIFFSMKAEGERRYIMLGGNSLFQAQNPLLQTTIHHHSNGPHTTGENYPEKTLFFIFPSATFFFFFFPNHCNYSQGSSLDMWSIWDTGMSFQCNFAHNYSTVRIATGPLVGLAIQQPPPFFF